MGYHVELESLVPQEKFTLDILPNCDLPDWAMVYALVSVCLCLFPILMLFFLSFVLEVHF